jgi:hypothetical protein
MATISGAPLSLRKAPAANCNANSTWSIHKLLVRARPQVATGAVRIVLVVVVMRMMSSLFKPFPIDVGVIETANRAKGIAAPQAD